MMINEITTDADRTLRQRRYQCAYTGRQYLSDSHNGFRLADAPVKATKYQSPRRTRNNEPGGVGQNSGAFCR